MRKANKIRHILQLYFGQNFSRYGRSLFGRWLKAEDNKELKTDLLHEFWEQSPSIITKQTYEDWNKLHKQITKQPFHKLIPIYHKWIRYAVVACLIILSIGATSWLIKQYNKPINITMTEHFVPYGESLFITLPDSSTVWLNAGSLLVYPTSFDNMETRTVYLTGEASFSAYKNQEKPFIVKTTYTDVCALGTIFTVKAYPNDSSTIATLEEGCISVSINMMDMEPSILKPNQQLVYRHHSNTINIHEIDISLYKMERNGYLIFENTSFSELVASLERKFNITVHYNSRKYSTGLYNVKFTPNETIEDVLLVLEQLIGIHYTINDKVVIIN